MHTCVIVTVEFNLIKSTLVIWFTKKICFFFGRAHYEIAKVILIE